MRACHRRSNRSRRSLGAIYWCMPPPSDGGRGAGDTVDAPVERIVPRELRALELLEKRRIADFPSAAFTIDEHAHVIDAPVGDDETRGDQLLLADLLQDPHAPVRVAPVALA